MGSCRRGQQACSANDEMLVAIRGRHPAGCLDSLAIEEAAVSADDKRPVRASADRLKNRLQVVLEIMRLPEYSHRFSEPRSAWTLIIVGARGHGQDVHLRSL